MTLWIVDYAAGGRGCPAVLRGTLNQPWSWNAHRPEPPQDVPPGYVYTARHPVLDLDYWDVNWLASERFVDVCRGFGLRVHPVPVEVLQSGGAPTAKSYFYLTWSEWASVIDLAASEVELDTDLVTGEPAQHRHFPGAPVLASVRRFVVDPSKVPSAAFKCLDLGHQLVCTDDFKQACEDAGLQGLAFCDLTGYTREGFWG